MIAELGSWGEGADDDPEGAAMEQGDIEAAAGGPLTGIRVLDLCDSSGRLAGKLLAELGADVVRLRQGEPGPDMVSVPGGLLDWWFDGGTAVLPLDLDDPADRDTLLALAGSADLLVHTEPPGRLDRFGLGTGRLAQCNPRLVQVALSPFGADGPRAGWQASDLTMTAAGGVLSVNGFPDEPVGIWGRQMDNTAGFYAAICGLAGLIRARRTGRGCSFDLSQQQAVMACTDHVLVFWWFADQLRHLGAPIARRQGSIHWIGAYEVVPCRSGYCMVSPSAGGVPQLLEWLAERGHSPQFPADPALLGSPEWIEAFMAALRAHALELDAHELFEGGQARHVPFGEVVGIPEVAANPQHQARGFLRPIEHGSETVLVPGPVARFGGTPCPPPQPPPLATPGDASEVLARWVAAPGQDVDGAAGGAPEGGTPHEGPAPDATGDDPRPLAGIRIIDFTHVLAGPFATRILADLGADVIRVQTMTRAAATAANDYPYNAMWGRSKRSITLNMRDERAVKVLRSLVEQADAVLENFSAGVLDDWGAGWSELSSWNDQIVYISMQGAGTDGPWREYVTFAPTVHALCGLTALSGPEGRVDCGTGIALTDHSSGLAAVLSLLAALEARRRTGAGQHIDLSQFEVGTYLMGPAVLDYLANGREARAAGTRDAFADHVPSDVVPTAGGGWLAVTARDDDDWSRLAPVLGAPVEWASADTRRRHRSEVRRLLEQWAATRTAAEAEAELQGHRVPASMVQDAATLTGDDPQLRHRDWELTVESPIWGTQRTDRFPALLHDADGSPIELTYAHSPYLGEHTFEVYEQLLGLDTAEIAERMGDGLFS